MLGKFMLRFFKKTKPESEFVAILKFDNPQFARVIADLFENMDWATRAHVLVAYENLLPVLTAMWSENKKRGTDFTVEQFIPSCADQIEATHGDEINSRRWSWFLFAALPSRLEKLSRNDAGIAEIGAKIWCMIACDAPRLRDICLKTLYGKLPKRSGLTYHWMKTKWYNGLSIMPCLQYFQTSRQ